MKFKCNRKWQSCSSSSSFYLVYPLVAFQRIKWGNSLTLKFWKQKTQGKETKSNWTNTLIILSCLTPLCYCLLFNLGLWSQTIVFIVYKERAGWGGGGGESESEQEGLLRTMAQLSRAIWGLFILSLPHAPTTQCLFIHFTSVIQDEVKQSEHVSLWRDTSTLQYISLHTAALLSSPIRSDLHV